MRKSFSLAMVIIFIITIVLSNIGWTVYASTDYYVSTTGNDNNNGTQNSPWRTIQKAADTVAAGDTVHVAQGTYYEDVTTNTSGTPGARILFISDVPWGAEVYSSGVNDVWTNYGDYVDIQGFDVTGDAENVWHGILNWGSYVRIIGNYVHDIPATDSGSNGGAGIDNADYQSSHNEVIGNVVCRMGNGTPSSDRLGIYMAHPYGTVINNIVYQCDQSAIGLWHAATDITIANNLLFNNYNGIQMGAGDAGATSCDNCTVSNNISVNNTFGIREMGICGTDIVNSYLNNCVYGNTYNFDLINGTVQGTVTSNANFVDYQSDGSGDYHLQSNSPCINACTSQGAPSYDYDGNSRPAGGGYDIGPYEYASASTPTPTPTATPAPSLPSGWSSGDIGSCTPTGSASYDSGTFTISGSGADVWNTSDAFQFCRTSTAGDCTIIARVTSQTNTHAGAKAGCMIRETLNADSSNAFVTITPSSGVTFQLRSSTGGSTSTTLVSEITTPIWLKLVRSGNNFSGYYSSNGTSWTQIGTTQSISMSSSAYSGLAVTSHVSGTLCTAEFDNVSN